MRVILFVFMMMLHHATYAQNNINSYEYWYNSNYAARQVQSISPVQQYTLNTQLSTASLPEGLHILNLRFKDDSARYSATLSQFFYKATATAGGAAAITAYQYWFNNDIAGAVSQAVSPTGTFSLNAMLATANLNSGLHILHLRFRDASGQWSSTVSQFFYKATESTLPGANQVNAWQYWFDNNIAQAQTMNIAPAGTVQLSEAIPVTTLAAGLHLLHLRFRDITGQWSSTISQFVYITPAIATGQNRMRTMQYWFDNNYADATNQALPEQQVVQINDMLSANALPDGLHTLHLRFADTVGNWSSTISQFFYKSAATGITTNVITGYRYWYNNEDATKMVVHRTEPQSILVLNRDFDMGCLTNGPNRLHLQFLDQKGQWSSALTDTISVTIPPSPIYRFTGNGNWSNAANWANNAKPALDLPGCKEILIDHVEGGTCVLDVPQHLLKNAKLIVLPGKRFVIPENLE